MADEAYFLHCILTMMGETLAEDGTGDGDQVDAYVWEGWGGGKGGGGRAARLLARRGGRVGGPGGGGGVQKEVDNSREALWRRGSAPPLRQSTLPYRSWLSVSYLFFRFCCCCFGDRICCNPLPPPLRWLTKRRQQVEAGALEYVAHNLDYCAVVRRQ